jgi:hypothetical protein
MIKQKAIGLLSDTFNHNFEINQFSKFIKELLNEFDLNLQDKTSSITKKYADYIESLEKLGDWEDQKGKEIEVLVIKLKKTSSRDRARTMQRDFIASLLGETEKDAALVAFYGDDPNDWRFSYVKMEYNLVKDDSWKSKPVKELTPAKRYSFLVGVNEPNHTCASQFVKLIMEEKINPSLEEIEQAFSIEKVTKEFFEKYKDLFLRLTESLEKLIKKDSKAKKELEEKGIDAVDFTKKLLGQIVFLYFLQKKGWLGVEKNEEGNFGKWGTGPKDFMKRLFSGDLSEYDNFFNDILEPLFYEALATERDDDYYSRFKCKIPFLNGGLFEPINDYNWRETDILIDNDIFRDIFKTFDEFNFTVKEDEPLEKEVAVDPEMLGKVFENLLEVKDRKSKGAFYTPREIVHYMCQQSLINYLETNSSIKRKDIENFILKGDNYLALTLLYESKNIDVTSDWTLPSSIKENYKEIDNLLKEIKIVDPAVGSGAFPIGMMNEIVKARSILSIYFKEDRKDYDLKRETIENCLYGVDIESSAVEITKLRFWLSLIVDELDMKNIKPLPNLDHKIMCGNSLLEEFEGVKLFDERLLGEAKKDNSAEIKQVEGEIAELNKEKGKIATGKSNGKSLKEINKEIRKLERKKQKIISGPKEKETFMTLDEIMTKRVKESKKKLSELNKLQKQFFNEQNKRIKKQLREDIDKIEWELIEETLKEEGNEEAIEKLKEIKKSNSKPFFLWKLYFAEVFQRENPGFDVVIANPPYVRQEEFREIKSTLEKEYTVFSARSDLYTFFYERSIKLLRKGAVLSFISSNKFMRANYGTKLRVYLKEKTRIMDIIDFGSVHKFEAITNTCVIVLKKEIFENNVFLYSDDISNSKSNKYPQKELRGDAWTLVDQNILELKSKIEDKGTKLVEWDIKISYGIKAGLNEAYILEKEEKESLLKKNPQISKIIKPLLRGRDIKRYATKFADKWIIISKYQGHKELMDKYPEIINHLKKFETKLKKRGQVRNGQHHWLELDNNPAENYLKLFEKDKIIWIELSDKNKFTYSNTGEFILAGAFMLTGESLKFILSFLNSKLCLFYFNLICNSSGMNTTQWKKFVLDRMPLIQINSEKQKPFIELVNQILSVTKDDDYLDNPDKQAKVKKLEKEIDQLVYELYELTPGEVKIVEGFNNGN